MFVMLVMLQLLPKPEAQPMIRSGLLWIGLWPDMGTPCWSTYRGSCSSYRGPALTHSPSSLCVISIPTPGNGSTMQREVVACLCVFSIPTPGNGSTGNAAGSSSVPVCVIHTHSREWEHNAAGLLREVVACLCVFSIPTPGNGSTCGSTMQAMQRGVLVLTCHRPSLAPRWQALTMLFSLDMPLSWHPQHQRPLPRPHTSHTLTTAPWAPLLLPWMLDTRCPHLFPLNGDSLTLAIADCRGCVAPSTTPAPLPSSKREPHPGTLATALTPTSLDARHSMPMPMPLNDNSLALAIADISVIPSTG
jgi:hypothetical protein